MQISCDEREPLIKYLFNRVLTFYPFGEVLPGIMYLYPMKYWFCFLLFLGCQTSAEEQAGADNALDAGRNYLQSCLQGDFESAARYCVPDSSLLIKLREEENAFRALDREGRQLHRTASIQVYGLEETDKDKARLVYGFSYDPEKKDTLLLKQINQRWFIVLSQ